MLHWAWELSVSCLLPSRSLEEQKPKLSSSLFKLTYSDKCSITLRLTEATETIGVLEHRDFILLTDTRSFSLVEFLKILSRRHKYSQILDISWFLLTSNWSAMLNLQTLLKFNSHIIYLVKWDGSILNQDKRHAEWPVHESQHVEKRGKRITNSMDVWVHRVSFSKSK